jgi:hypothetical protein
LAETVGIPHEARLKYYEAGSVPFFFNLIPAEDKCNATAQCFKTLIMDGVNLTEGLWPNFVVSSNLVHWQMRFVLIVKITNIL